MNIKFSQGGIRAKSVGEDFRISLENIDEKFHIYLNRLNKKGQTISYTREALILKENCKILFELGLVLFLIKKMDTLEGKKILHNINFDKIFIYKGKIKELIKVIKKYYYLTNNQEEEISRLFYKKTNVEVKKVMNIVLENGKAKFDEILITPIKYTLWGLIISLDIKMLFNWKKYKNMKNYFINVYYVNSKEGEEAPYNNFL